MAGVARAPNNNIDVNTTKNDDKNVNDDNVDVDGRSNLVIMFDDDDDDW